DMSGNAGSTNYRNIPDVAAVSDNVWTIYHNNGAQTNGGFLGTSIAAPLWAGLTALANQQAVGAGNAPIGFLNPALYTIGQSVNYTNCFHDIAAGDTFWPGSPSNYAAVAGYDLCTGWG